MKNIIMKTSEHSAMCRIFLATLLLVGIYHAYGAAVDSNEKILNFLDRMTILLEKKCLENANQQAYAEVLEQLKQLRDDCFTLPFNPTKEITKTCRKHNEKILRCLTTFGEKLEPCLGHGETYLKQFIPDVYRSSFEHVCDFIKFIDIPLLLKLDAAECMKTIKEHKDINPHIVCYQNSSIIGDNSTVDIITKKELCLNLQQTDLCLSESFDKLCPNEPEVAKFQRGLILPGFEECMNVDVRDN